jgi:hypothetical protein
MFEQCHIFKLSVCYYHVMTFDRLILNAGTNPFANRGYVYNITTHVQTSATNLYRVFQKELYNCIPNVTVLRVL